MSLKPQNIVQAAEADMKRALHNAEMAQFKDPTYEQYAFHRKHVRRAGTASELLMLALMDPTVAVGSKKANTRLIYGDARLLVAAIRTTAG